MLYMFWMVPPPIIRNAYNCIYSIWYLSHRYCYLPLSWKCWNGPLSWKSWNCSSSSNCSSNSSTIAAGSSNWKLLYMFRVVPLLIIRSAYNCIYSVWYLSHRYCSSSSSTIAAGSSNGVSNTRRCRYSCMRSWWWVEVPPETCRAVSRYK